MTNPIATLDDGVVRQLLNVGAAFASLQLVADIIESAAFDEADAQAIGWLPVDLRLHTIARLIEATEAVREELREIDAVLLTLTDGQHQPA